MPSLVTLAGGELVNMPEIRYGSRDADALARGILDLLRDGALRQKLGSAAQAWVRGHDADWTARMRLDIGEGRRIKGSDLYDAHHYVAASYTDLISAKEVLSVASL